MSDSNIRTIKISSVPATPVLSNNSTSDDFHEDVKPVTQRRQRRQTRSRKTTAMYGGAPVIDGVDDSQPLPKVDIGKPIIPVVNITKIQSGGSSNNSAAQTGSNTSKSNIPPEPRLSTGGSQEATQVILKRKNRTSKILLKKRTGGVLVPTADTTNTSGESASSKSNTPSSTQNTKITGAGHASKTRSSRKLVVKNIGTKAKRTRHAVKKIINHAKELPLEKLKKHLIDKKLIKPNSKAPESVLRQIYADSVIVGKKAL